MKKWFRGFQANSIVDFQAFENAFLRNWGDKKKPLQLLTQYNNLKKNTIEIVQEFSTKFMKAYDSIPDEVKPLVGVAQLHYANAYESDFSLLLRERIFVSVEDIMNDANEVEVNMMAYGKIK